MKYKYVIFDFDGTLADTEKVNFLIYQKLAHKYKLRNLTIEELGFLKKMSAKELMEYVELKKRHLPFILKRGKKLLREDIKNVPFCKNNMIEIIEKLKNMGVKTAIVTTNSKKNVNIFLHEHRANIFDVVRSASMFGKESMMKKLIKKEKISSNEVLYVGDEIRDIHAANKAGIDIASVAWGYNTVDSLKKQKPNYLINDPEELIDLCISR